MLNICCILQYLLTFYVFLVKLQYTSGCDTEPSTLQEYVPEHSKMDRVSRQAHKSLSTYPTLPGLSDVHVISHGVTPDFTITLSNLFQQIVFLSLVFTNLKRFSTTISRYTSTTFNLLLLQDILLFLWRPIFFGFSQHQRHSVLVLSSLFLVLPFLPASNLLVIVGFVVAERILYIPR